MNWGGSAPAVACSTSAAPTHAPHAHRAVSGRANATRDGANHERGRQSLSEGLLSSGAALRHVQRLRSHRRSRLLRVRARTGQARSPSLRSLLRTPPAQTGTHPGTRRAPSRANGARRGEAVRSRPHLTQPIGPLRPHRPRAARRLPRHHGSNLRTTRNRRRSTDRMARRGGRRRRNHPRRIRRPRQRRRIIPAVVANHHACRDTRTPRVLDSGPRPRTLAPRGSPPPSTTPTLPRMRTQNRHRDPSSRTRCTRLVLLRPMRLGAQRPRRRRTLGRRLQRLGSRTPRNQLHRHRRTMTPQEASMTPQESTTNHQARNRRARRMPDARAEKHAARHWKRFSDEVDG